MASRPGDGELIEEPEKRTVEFIKKFLTPDSFSLLFFCPVGELCLGKFKCIRNTIYLKCFKKCLVLIVCNNPDLVAKVFQICVYRSCR